MAAVVVGVGKKVKIAVYALPSCMWHGVFWKLAPTFFYLLSSKHNLSIIIELWRWESGGLNPPPLLPPQYIEELRGIILTMEIGPTDIEMVVINSESEHVENPGEDTPVELQASHFPENGGNGSPSVLLGWYSTAKSNLILAINSVQNIRHCEGPI